MNELEQLARDLQLEEAKRAIKRYKKNRLAFAEECFRTIDRKDTKQKLSKSWPRNAMLRRIWEAIEKREAEEYWALKPRQVFFSNLMCGLIGAEIVLVPGTSAAVQAQNEEKSTELLYRTADILRDLGGAMEGMLVEGEDWKCVGNTIEVMRVLGERIDSIFTALPEGYRHWNMPSLSIGWLDEFPLNPEGKKAYHSASAACQGGGILVVNGTSVFDTFFNNQVGIDLVACGEDPRSTTLGFAA